MTIVALVLCAFACLLCVQTWFYLQDGIIQHDRAREINAEANRVLDRAGAALLETKALAAQIAVERIKFKVAIANPLGEKNNEDIFVPTGSAPPSGMVTQICFDPPTDPFFRWHPCRVCGEELLTTIDDRAPICDACAANST